MSQQEIDIGAVANDGSGDTLRAASAKINANFTELYSAVGSGVVSDGGNTFFGEDAGNASLTGEFNTAIGYQAGMSLTSPVGVTDAGNVLLGYQAGKALTTGRESVVIGYKAGLRLTGNGAGVEDGINTIIGSLAGENLTTSMGNILLGQKAGENLQVTGTISGYNVMIGTHGGTGVSTGNYNVYIGNQVMDVSPVVTGGDENVIIGNQAGGGRGDRNVLIGNQVANALSNTGADFNVWVGAQTGQLRTNSTQNTFVGHAAGVSGTGNDNTYVGYTAGNAGTTAEQNTFIGSQAGAGASLAAGSYNVGVGYIAGNSLTSGSRNTFVGHGAGTGITTGGFNIVIGHGNGVGVTTGSANTIIGSNLSGLSASLAGNVILADGSGTIRAQADQNGLWTVGVGASAGIIVGATTGDGGKFQVNDGADGTSIAASFLGQFKAVTNRNNLAPLLLADNGASGVTWAIGAVQGAGYCDFRDTTTSGSPIVLSLHATEGVIANKMLNASAGLKGGIQDLNGPGAVNLTTLTTKWGTTGGDAGTLADGTEGQLKMIIMDADGGDGTLTPSNFGNGTTITFDDVGDFVLLQFIGSDWWVVSNSGCVVA